MRQRGHNCKYISGPGQVPYYTIIYYMIGPGNSDCTLHNNIIYFIKAVRFMYYSLCMYGYIWNKELQLKMFTRGAWIHWALHIYHYIYLLWLFLSKPTTSILTRKNVQVHRLCFEACQGQRSWHKFKASPVPMPGANRKVPTGVFGAFQEGVEGCVLVKANKLKVFVWTFTLKDFHLKLKTQRTITNGRTRKTAYMNLLLLTR